MKEDNTLVELVEIVKNLGRIYNEEDMRVGIDFDPNDGIIMVKYQSTNPAESTLIINSNNKTISGIDTAKHWLPNYSKTQKANKKILQFLEDKGYSSVNIIYKKK